MSIQHNYPVILVSAANEVAASRIISDIIDKEPPESEVEQKLSCCRLWRITNKYYTSDVQLHAVLDGQRPALDTSAVQGHVIYLTEDECTEGVAERRCVGAGAFDEEGVRLVAVEGEGEREGEVLSAWARRRRYELVPLVGVCEPPADEPFPELSGIPRVREALHAHRWTRTSRTPADGESSEAESSDGDGYHSEGDEVAVERAQEFAAMLGIVSGGERDQLAELSRGERLRRAEDLVSAFCRAMGHDPDRW